MIPPTARSGIHERLIARYEAAFGIVKVVASVCAGFAIAVGAAYAQPKAPAFGNPGERIHLVVGFQPYYVVTWTAAIARDKEVPAHVDRVLAKPPKLREALALLCRPAASETIA